MPPLWEQGREGGCGPEPEVGLRVQAVGGASQASRLTPHARGLVPLSENAAHSPTYPPPYSPRIAFAVIVKPSADLWVSSRLSSRGFSAAATSSASRLASSSTVASTLAWVPR